MCFGQRASRTAAMSRSTNSRRGSTLVELLVASAVLAIGMTAVVTLLLFAARSTNDAGRRVEASLAGHAALEELLSTPYSDLAAGTYDGGIVYGQDGTSVVYRRTVRVSDLATDPAAMDAGANSAGFVLAVDVTYQTGLLANRTQTYATIYTAPFDGGN